MAGHQEMEKKALSIKLNGLKNTGLGVTSPPSTPMGLTKASGQGGATSPPTTPMGLTKASSQGGPTSPPMTPMRLTKASSGRYHCLCSPTTHAGSFRCRHHRSSSGLSRSGMSVGSKLSELGKSSGMCSTLHAQ